MSEAEKITQGIAGLRVADSHCLLASRGLLINYLTEGFSSNRWAIQSDEGDTGWTGQNWNCIWRENVFEANKSVSYSSFSCSTKDVSDYESRRVEK